MATKGRAEIRKGMGSREPARKRLDSGHRWAGFRITHRFLGCPG